MKNNGIRFIAFYLPQYHPIEENDKWWGKGFTEWANVGKAKKLFPGHKQPKIPADLGYYDLRLKEVREAQADLAREAGIEGFCYWHYWFSGKKLLERPFQEVLTSRIPDYPFCLCWANHTWYAKTWDKDKPDKVLIEQEYPGEKDNESHFYDLLPAFKDKRYIKVDGKPFFGIFAPRDLPKTDDFIKQWNRLAIENGFNGMYFTSFSVKYHEKERYLNNGYNGIILDLTFVRNSFIQYFSLLLSKLNLIPKLIDYNKYIKNIQKNMPSEKGILPCLVPNFDHTPRSGKKGSVMINSSPDKWYKLISIVISKMKDKPGDENIVIIKSWNEWGEGNYMEPDLEYGKGYIKALRKAIDDVEYHQLFNVVGKGR